MTLMADDSLGRFAWSTPLDDAEMFELAPISLWLCDLSLVKQLLEQWRAEGMTDLREHFLADPARIALCYTKMRFIKVNQQTLRLFGATDLRTAEQALAGFIKAELYQPFIDELLQLWSGQPRFHTQSGRRSTAGQWLDRRVSGSILPGYGADWTRVLVAVEDLTVQEQTRRQLVDSERYARSLFEQSPVSLWVEDYGRVKVLLDGLREAGVTDLSAHIAAHPEFALQCMRELRVIDVNRQTLALFAAPDKATLLARIDEVVRESRVADFVRSLECFWNGKLQNQLEVVNHTLTGEALNLVLDISVVPGHEDDWALVLVAKTDVTARKQAEAHLQFLSRHDALTGLHNRAFYLEEIARLDQLGPHPVAVIIADLDGLKAANDADGHAAGDALLCRGANVLRQASAAASCVARIGGDEFAIFIPAAEPLQAGAAVARIETLVARDNAAAPAGGLLQLSVGRATCRQPGDMERAIRRADLRMYEAKRARYAATPEQDRRL